MSHDGVDLVPLVLVTEHSFSLATKRIWRVSLAVRTVVMEGNSSDELVPAGAVITGDAMRRTSHGEHDQKRRTTSISSRLTFFS